MIPLLSCPAPHSHQNPGVREVFAPPKLISSEMNKLGDISICISSRASHHALLFSILRTTNNCIIRKTISRDKIIFFGISIFNSNQLSFAFLGSNFRCKRSCASSSNLPMNCKILTLVTFLMISVEPGGADSN